MTHALRVRSGDDIAVAPSVSLDKGMSVPFSTQENIGVDDSRSLRGPHGLMLIVEVGAFEVDGRD